MNADQIYLAIRQRHKLPQWVLVRELRLNCGWAPQRIDAWAMNCHPSKGCWRIAYEIKLSRSDFRAEKKDPEKRKTAMAVADFFYFAAPRGLIAPMDVPDDCGLLAVYESGRSMILKRAPRTNAKGPDWWFVAAVLRNLTDARLKDLPDTRWV